MQLSGALPIRSGARQASQKQFAEALEQPKILAQYRDIQERIAAVLAQYKMMSKLYFN
jgi:hypothetical protein